MVAVFGAAMTLSPSKQMPSRPAVLRESLLSTIDLLDRRRASEIGDAVIDDYVSMNWLEWHGGALRLTITGEGVRKQLLTSLEST
jgi:hypothetical protein